MHAQYEEDLRGATEIVVHVPRRGGPGGPRGKGRLRGARSGRAATGALRIANTVGAAITNRRVVEPGESGILLGGALVLLGGTAIAWYWPRVIAWRSFAQPLA